MVEERIQRRLVAILAADVVGYSRLMGEDEEATLAALKACRKITDQLIEVHEGRIFGGAGDSFVAEFVSPVAAMRCATEIQLALDNNGPVLPSKKPMRFRIGINIGDVIVDGDGLMGDGVNIAARLEALAPPGGVCVSDGVQNQVRDRLSLDFLDMGEHVVKNIVKPIRVYRVPLPSEERIASPYRGLDMFEFEHADLFFGRAAAIAAAKRRLERQADAGTAFLLIYGMSGAGKSSLLRAGLLPALIKPQAGGGIALMRHCLIRPSERADPIEALAGGLMSETAVPQIKGSPSVSEIAKLLRRAPAKSSTIVRNALFMAAEAVNVDPRFAHLVIAVDQMEELFTSNTVDAATRAVFIKVLSELARSGHTWVVGTIRADFFHRCGEVPGFSALKDGLGSYELLPPTGPEIAQLIREPAIATGFRFEDDPNEGNLADVLQQSAVQDPGSLPLLEFVLDALYEAGKEQRLMSYAAYRALGGLEGAIARRADEVTSALPDNVQRALPAIISALTTVRQQDDATTGRPAPREEIARTEQQTALVDALTEARLLISAEGPDGVPKVRLAHEALLSNWPRARDVVAANREFLATRSRVQADAQRWLAEDKAPDLLLPDGKRLAEAEDLLAGRRDEIDQDVTKYVEASISVRQAREGEVREVERQALEATMLRAKRARIAAVVMLILALFAGAGTIVGITGQREAARQADDARLRANDALEAKDKAQKSERHMLQARDQALRTQSLFLAFQARGQAAAGNATTAVRLALEALPGDLLDRPYVAEAEAALRDSLIEFRQIHVFRHDGGVAYAQYSPRGDRLVTASFDHTARIWNSNDGALVSTLRGHSDALEKAQFSPNGDRIVTASHDGTVRIWDVESGREIDQLNLGSRVRFASFGPGGERIIIGTEIGTLTIWEPKRRLIKTIPGSFSGRLGEAVFSPDGQWIIRTEGSSEVKILTASNGIEITRIAGEGVGWVTAIAYSPDGQRILFSGQRNAVLWDAVGNRKVAFLTGHKSTVRWAGFSADGRIAVTTSVDGSARVWNANTGDLVTALGKDSGIQLTGVLVTMRSDFSGAISSDGSYLATGALDGVVRVWDIKRDYRLTLLRGHTGPVEHVAFSPDGRNLVSASHDGTARLWEIDGVLATELKGHQRRPTFIKFSPDSSLVATAANDATVRIWDASDGNVVAILGDHGGVVTHLDFSPDGGRIATASQDSKVRLWEVNSGREVISLQGHEAGVKFVDFSKDGQSIVTASNDGTARLWDVSTGQVRAVLEGHGKNVNVARFGLQDRFILTASDDATARLWKISDPGPMHVMSGHKARINAAEFNPGGSLVATASNDQSIRLWDVGNGKLVRELSGHNAPIVAAKFSPDGRLIASASKDHTARIWSVQSGAQFALLSDGGPVTQIAFSPDGKILATTSRDGTARIWRVADGSKLMTLTGHSTTYRHVAFSPDGKFVATVSDDKIGRIFRVFSTTREVIDFSRSLVPDALTPCERKHFFLAADKNVGECSDNP